MDVKSSPLKEKSYSNIHTRIASRMGGFLIASKLISNTIELDMQKKLIENIHYYLNSEGLMVFTEKYHSERGYCCQSGCKHCPYEYHSKVDPSVPSELQDPWGKDEEEEIEIYDGPIEE